MSLNKSDLTTGSPIARGDHQEDRVTIYTTKGWSGSYVISVCRETCNNNTNINNKLCKDIAFKSTSAGSDDVTRGWADTNDLDG